jgi:thiol-disulfide isomerase/thioredoxin
MKAPSLILFFILSSTFLFSQDFFKVELEKRSPDVQDLVRSYEGFPVIPFIANDLDGNEQNFANLSGDKTTIIYFWNLGSESCKKQIDALNLLKQNFSTKLDIVSLADDTKKEIFDYRQTSPIDFPIIPNAKLLADGPYGGDLGYPRIFIVDDFGIIRWVFAQESFDNGMDTYRVMETLLTQLSQEGK